MGCKNVTYFIIHTVGRDSSVGISTGYGLRGPGIEFQLGGGSEFSRTSSSRPEPDPASHTSPSGLFSEVNRSVHVFTTNLQLARRLKEMRAGFLPPFCAITARYRVNLLYIYVSVCVHVYKAENGEGMDG